MAYRGRSGASWVLFVLHLVLRPIVGRTDDAAVRDQQRCDMVSSFAGAHIRCGSGMLGSYILDGRCCIFTVSVPSPDRIDMFIIRQMILLLRHSFLHTASMPSAHDVHRASYARTRSEAASCDRPLRRACS